MPFTAAVTHDGDWYVAQCLEIDVASQGRSIEAALANLREALELKLEDEPVSYVPKEPPIVASIEITPRSPAA